MTIIWVIVEVLFILMFYHLPPVEEVLLLEKQRSPKHKNNAQVDHLHSGPTAAANNVLIEGNIPDESLGEVTKSTKDMFKYSQSVQVQDGAPSENSPLLPHFSVNRPPTYCNNSNSNNPHEEAVTVQASEGKPNSLCQRVGSALRHLAWMISELLREEMVVLLAILFITIFSQTTTEVYYVSLMLFLQHLQKSPYCITTKVEVILCNVSGYAGTND